jgi:ferredoxin-NADP reductase
MAVLAVHAVWLVACELMSPKKTVDRAKHQTSPQPPSAPPTFVATTVLAVLDETDDVRTFRMARPAGMPFSAGQFLAVKALIDGKPHVRCYSISSAPHVLGYLEISVRRQGLVSGTLHATIRAGSTLSINRPAGQFVYPQDDDRPLVLIAGGIGITPLLSMLRHATATDPVRPITLLYSARTENDVAFRRELALIAERHPQVRIAITLTRATADTRLRTGRIDADLMRQYVSAPSHTIFCLCGPAPMLDEVRAVLLALGVGPDQIRHEQFELAVAASHCRARRRPSGRRPAPSPCGSRTRADPSLPPHHARCSRQQRPRASRLPRRVDRVCASRAARGCLPAMPTVVLMCSIRPIVPPDSFCRA